MSTKQGGSMDALLTKAKRITRSVAHRGPDDEGFWVDPQCGVALGHNRLSILDLSSEGHQPMVSASGRYIITFNGEIYNFQELRSRLECHSTSFRGHSDTEVMLAAFEEWGLQRSLQYFNGMFAFALWDRHERCMTLVCDRFGEKPLYYGLVGSDFVFGSELKALRAHPGFQGEIDRDSLSLFLRLAYVPSPYSIYKGIRKLPPGTFLTIEAGGAPHAPTAYWSLREVAEAACADPLRMRPEEACDALDDLLNDAVRLRLVSDVPLGAFFSGGVDSSTVVALMQRHSSSPVRTFTIGSEESSYNEAEYARAIANHLGTQHTELIVTAREARTMIPELPRIYDEPFADSSQIPTFLVSKLARQHVTVSLSGDGGDELFGGYNRHYWAQAVWNRFGGASPLLKSAMSKALLTLPPASWDYAITLLQKILPKRLNQRNPAEKLQKLARVLASKSPEEMYLHLVSSWDDPTSVVRGADGHQTVLTDRQQWASLAEFSQSMMYLDAMTYLTSDILVKLDRAAMAVALETRTPLLDHRVAAFAWRLPTELKIRNGQGKWLMRQVLYRYVPKKLVERPKSGFAIPIHAWIRGELRDWADALLDEQRLRREGFFYPDPIRQKWSEHLSGRRNWVDPLWNVIMFQAWFEYQHRTAPQHAICSVPAV